MAPFIPHLKENNFYTVANTILGDKEMSTYIDVLWISMKLYITIERIKEL